MRRRFLFASALDTLPVTAPAAFADRYISDAIPTPTATHTAGDGGVAAQLGAIEAKASEAEMRAGAAHAAGELDASGRRAHQAEVELARVKAQLADLKNAHAASEQERSQLKDEVDGLSVAARVAEREAMDARRRVEATLAQARADAAVRRAGPGAAPGGWPGGWRPARRSAVAAL